MISQRVRTKAKNISGSFKTPLTSKKNSYLFKNQSKSKTTMQMMKNIVTYVKGI